MKITFDLDEEQAFALLRFLYDVRPSEIAQFHEGIEWAVFDRHARNCAWRCVTVSNRVGVMSPRRYETVARGNRMAGVPGVGRHRLYAVYELAPLRKQILEARKSPRSRR
jgi:hypothetical protein